MRVWIVLLLLPLAGCLDDEPEQTFQAVAGMDEGKVAVWTNGTYTLMAPAGVPPYHFQLCDEGLRVVQFAHEPNANPDDRQCDFRVTKPLLDATQFDWVNQHGPANEVSLAANPLDPFNLVGGGKDYTVSYISEEAGCGAYTVWNGAYWSHDGGRTWGNDLIPGFPGDQRQSPLKGNACNTDPVIVFDRDGTVWHNGLNYRGAREDTGDPINPIGNGGLVTGSQVFFARSQDGGASFDRITFASYGQNDPGIFNDKNWLAVDPKSDHMIHTWTNFYNGVPIIEYVESLDAGATWTHPTPFPPGPDDAGANVPIGQFSMPQYDSMGNVHVIWSSGGVVESVGTRADGIGPVVFGPTTRAFSYDAGLGGAGCLANTNFRASMYPVLAIDARQTAYRDQRYVTYAQAGDNGTGVFVRVHDGTWGPAIEVTAGLPDDQFMPWIDVDPMGGVHVAYYDCSPGGNNMTVGYVNSFDGGKTWSEAMLIGQVPFNGDLGHHQNGAPFIGDYIAVDTSCAGVHFMWADTRHTGESGRPAGSDVYAATVALDWPMAQEYAPEIQSKAQGVTCF